MPFKTILAIIEDSDAAEKLSGCASAMAERFDAHLIGLHAEVVPMPYTSAIGFPDTELVQATAEANRERSKELAAIFAKATRDAGISAEWQSIDSFSGDTAHAGMAAARCSDLVIVGQSESNATTPEVDTLLYEAGRPLLVMPHDAPCLSSFRRVIVAWNGSREAARATFDALPLILEAEATEILCIDAPEAPGALPPGTDIAAALSRHGAEVSVHAEETGDRTADEVMRDRLLSTGADLLVLGAYSHSWLRELLFGGVTRSAVRAMPVATFLSR